MMTAASQPARLHAIYLCLGDSEFLEASVRSIYRQVVGITVMTTYDRDWLGNTVEPDPVVEMVLSRHFDPDRKIELIVSNETNEARSRNRAMDFASPRRKSRSVRRQSPVDASMPDVDYFLIIDPDEIYEERDLSALRHYVMREQRPAYRVAARRYFKNWRTRVTGYEWSLALVRNDVRTSSLRMRKSGLAQRVGGRLLRPAWPSLSGRVKGFVDIPETVGCFHHGSYVGPRKRIQLKIDAGGHGRQFRSGWMEDVWDRWSPSMRNFHPVWPGLFESAEEIAADQLPVTITAAEWPPGYF